MPDALASTLRHALAREPHYRRLARLVERGALSPTIAAGTNPVLLADVDLDVVRVRLR